MKHQLKVSVSKKPSSDSVMRCRKVSMRERLLRFLFGNKRDIVVLIPSDRIEEVAIKKKGDQDE
ncbi:hypothetical protein ACMZ6Z_00050 [Streptococcus pluranimalium]|uniref:Uncharacterized protein n=1 Tax=Helcococcus bovis TaxID=3153252 RepID=A0ABW9F6W9_9FIRM|nr:hypothetical protein [Streptococcus agalactiae]HEM2695149.1 hypothetical protein [Streptococcus suis]KAF1268402.1 hypothetical protein B8V77_04270 [Streptococcus agalactiae]MCD0153415.1 hypothetical protein [Streptococcus agalactiae]RRA51974.1 hypothetical protein D5F80_10455 [Streptococcus agalactiae]HEM2709472.1 hypothetical protein [Streptococcus suis]